jgi:hypothetical protein
LRASAAGIAGRGCHSRGGVAAEEVVTAEDFVTAERSSQLQTREGSQRRGVSQHTAAARGGAEPRFASRQKSLAKIERDIRVRGQVGRTRKALKSVAHAGSSAARGGQHGGGRRGMRELVVIGRRWEGSREVGTLLARVKLAEAPTVDFGKFPQLSRILQVIFSCSPTMVPRPSSLSTRSHPCRPRPSPQRECVGAFLAASNSPQTPSPQM